MNPAYYRPRETDFRANNSTVYEDVDAEERESSTKLIKLKFCVVGRVEQDVELMRIIRTYFNADIGYSTTGYDYLEDKNVIFLLNDFESDIFNRLNRNEALIVGPTVLRACEKYNLEFSTLRPFRPIYCRSMDGMRFTFNDTLGNREISRAVSLIHFMGGSARKDYAPNNIFISNRAMGERYRHAANIGIVLNVDWIHNCWEHRNEIDFSANDPNLMESFRLKCFQGLQLYFVGFFEDHDFDEIKERTQENGGIIVTKYEEATHVVFASKPAAPEDYKNSKIKHVTLEWFWKSISVGWCVAEEDHIACVVLPSSLLKPPLQSCENILSRRVPALPIEKSGRQLRNESSKASLENLENSNNSSFIPENMYSSDNLEPSSAKIDKRYSVCREILDTEENYLNMLKLLEEQFKNPLLNLAGKEGELLNKNEIHVIFGKLAPIIHTHTEIVKKLRGLIADGHWNENNMVGKVWLDATDITPKSTNRPMELDEFGKPKKDPLPLEKVYLPYINSYNEALDLLNACDLERPKFHCFIKLEESKEHCRKNSLRDILIRPVQRMPSVLLLLQELLKQTNKANPDYNCVKSAIENLKLVLRQVNDSRYKTDTYKHFLEVCNDIELFPSELFSSAREFVQSLDVVVLVAGGVFQKLKNRTITFFLFNDFVVMAKCRDNTTTAYMNSTVSSFGGTSTIRDRGSTLNRQISFSSLRSRRHKPYKFISTLYFVTFREVLVIKGHSLFVVKMRDTKAEELCCFQLTNGTTHETGMEFFIKLQKYVKNDSGRDFPIDELTTQQLEPLSYSHPEDVEIIRKGISLASTDSTSYGTIARPSQLRRTLSNVSMGISSGLNRFASRSNLGGLGSFTSRSRLSNIGEPS